MPVPDQARHLRELRDGYGGADPESLLEAMVVGQRRIVGLETANLGNSGPPAARRQHAKAAVAWAAADCALLRQHEARARDTNLAANPRRTYGVTL